MSHWFRKMLIKAVGAVLLLPLAALAADPPPIDGYCGPQPPNSWFQFSSSTIPAVREKLVAFLTDRALDAYPAAVSQWFASNGGETRPGIGCTIQLHASAPLAPSVYCQDTLSCSVRLSGNVWASCGSQANSPGLNNFVYESGGCYFVYTPSVTAMMAATSPLIPQSSVVSAGKVLTKVDLLATVLERGSPASGKAITFGSNRGATVDLFSPVSSLTTDTGGTASVQASTRNQPATSVLSASIAGVATPAIASVTWLPAKYESQFLVTCYTIANESLAEEKPVSSGVCGLPEKQSYRDAFLKDVKMQGSGVALDGTTIHYAGRGCFNTDTCARTATGACATVGTTVAVDPNIIPKRSSVNVKIIGSRTAQDTGGRITGYHIDEYLGPQPKLCKQLGRRTSDVIFQNY